MIDEYMKSGVKKRVTPKPSGPEASAGDSIAALQARTQIIALTVNMGWRMAIAVILPVFVGVKLDQKFNTSPSWTITAFFLAVAASAMIVARTVREVNEMQASSAKPKRRKNA
jgi:F0F1-type ATP synthase assembly protein I